MSHKYILLQLCIVKSHIAPLSSELLTFVSDKKYRKIPCELNETSLIIYNRASKKNLFILEMVGIDASVSRESSETAMIVLGCPRNFVFRWILIFWN